MLRISYCACVDLFLSSLFLPSLVKDSANFVRKKGNKELACSVGADGTCFRSLQGAGCGGGRLGAGLGRPTPWRQVLHPFICSTAGGASGPPSPPPASLQPPSAPVESPPLDEGCESVPSRGSAAGGNRKGRQPFRRRPGVSALLCGALRGLSAQQAVPRPWAPLAEPADLAGKRLRFRTRGPAWPLRLLCLRPASQLVARKPVGCPFTAKSHWVWCQRISQRAEKGSGRKRTTPHSTTEWGHSHAEVTGAPVTCRPLKAPPRPASEPTPTGAAPWAGQGCSGSLPRDPNHSVLLLPHGHTRHTQTHTQTHTLTYTPTQIHSDVCMHSHTHSHSHTHADAQTH